MGGKGPLCAEHSQIWKVLDYLVLTGRLDSSDFNCKVPDCCCGSCQSTHSPALTPVVLTEPSSTEDVAKKTPKRQSKKS